MGAPLEDAGRLWDWSRWIQRQFGMNVVAERPQIEQAVVEFYAYAGELLGRRRAEPGDDLISTLIAAEQEGDRLSDVETLNLVLNVLVGGVDTTQSQLAHALRLFAEHPEQWAMLAENPLLAPAAVEEVVRFEPITPFTARIAMEDVTYRDVEFPEGTIVLVSAFTGNREGTAEGFDITADRTGREAAHLRRRRALLPGREPRPRGDAGGARVPRARGCPGSRSTASRSTGRSTASTGSTRCRSAGRPDPGPRRLRRRLGRSPGRSRGSRSAARSRASPRSPTAPATPASPPSAPATRSTAWRTCRSSAARSATPRPRSARPARARSTAPTRGRTRVRRLGAVVGAADRASSRACRCCWLYLPGRVAEAGDRRRILGRLREGDPAIEELLATRAVAHLPYRTLLAITPDPAEDLRAGRHGRARRRRAQAAAARRDARAR